MEPAPLGKVTCFLTAMLFCLFQGSRVAGQNLYLFHPSYPNVLLELNNITERIITFDGECCSLDPSGRDAARGGWAFALPSLGAC